MQKKRIRMLAGIVGMGMVLLMCCTACSGERQEISKNETLQIPFNDNGSGDVMGNNGASDENKSIEIEGNDNAKPQVEDETGDGQSDSKFYAGADLSGSVVEFSDSGFELSPAKVTKDEAGGEIMEQAAPGAEKEEDLVTITYADGVTFQIITMDSSSLKEISREDTEKASVKKQSSVLVFGSCQDTYHWTAEKIIIMRWK